MDSELKGLLIQTEHIVQRISHTPLPQVEIAAPRDTNYAMHLAKIVAKLSPFVANLIEYRLVEMLNMQEGIWPKGGFWKRQDPGFPDAVLIADLPPHTGIEIKTWFPLATEITARLRDSVRVFDQDQTLLALIAWVPEYIIYGRPHIIAVWIGSARSIAIARDRHYHQPPDYIVIEPEETRKRTRNLQQSNVSGYKFQGNDVQRQAAQAMFDGWGLTVTHPTYDPLYQTYLRQLRGAFPYRLDTNFAKINRIEHVGVNNFKQQVLDMHIHGLSILKWQQLLRTDGHVAIERIMQL